MFRLMQPPKTLEELRDSLTLLETLKSNLAKTEAEIPLIHERFAILDKYEVELESSVSIHLFTKPNKYINGTICNFN